MDHIFNVGTDLVHDFMKELALLNKQINDTKPKEAPAVPDLQPRQFIRILLETYKRKSNVTDQAKVEEVKQEASVEIKENRREIEKLQKEIEKRDKQIEKLKEKIDKLIG